LFLLGFRWRSIRIRICIRICIHIRILTISNIKLNTKESVFLKVSRTKFKENEKKKKHKKNLIYGA